jgi:hypothetical protein
VELSRKRARKARNLRGEWADGKLVLSGTGGTEAPE